ncbi:hypothetical protein R0G64_31825, partial [Pseudomonas otitidis]|nr:hypothetical protein [Pseudomonas otitidis]
RLTLRAPRDARVDALPYKPGDQPPAGAELASLLVGEAAGVVTGEGVVGREGGFAGDAADLGAEGGGDALYL